MCYCNISYFQVLRVEQTGLGTVFMCTHSGTRYGNTGCRRTYLSQVRVIHFEKAIIKIWQQYMSIKKLKQNGNSCYFFLLICPSLLRIMSTYNASPSHAIFCNVDRSGHAACRPATAFYIASTILPRFFYLEHVFVRAVPIS